MRFIKESKWRVELMTGAPNVQMIEKILDAPSQEVAIHRAQIAFPNQQFVQVSATLMDPQTNSPSGTASQTQQTSMDRMRGLVPLRGLAQPGQQAQPPQQRESRLDIRTLSYPYSITLPAQFARLLRETAPVRVSENQGQHHIVLETEHDMKSFLQRMSRHHDRNAVRTIITGIRSSLL